MIATGLSAQTKVEVQSEMTAQSDKNQRNFFRCNIELPLFFSIIRGRDVVGHYRGRTLNLSGGGMLFVTDCPLLQTGTLILAEFAHPGNLAQLPVELPQGDFLARVLREEDKNDDPNEKRYLLAVEFKFLHKATRNEIVAFLNRYEVMRRKHERD